MENSVLAPCTTASSAEAPVVIRHGVTVDDWVLRCAKAEVSRVAKLTRQKHGQPMTQSNPLALPLLPIDRQSMLGRVTPWAAGQALRRWDGRVPNCTNFPLCSPQVLSLVARKPNQARRMQGRVFLKISPFLTAGRCWPAIWHRNPNFLGHSGGAFSAPMSAWG